MGMILNGEMRRTANHKMTVSVIRQWFCVNILQFSESDQSFSVFTITSTFLTSCHLAFTVFGYFSIRMSAVRWINESSTSCFIGGHENNNDKLGFDQCVYLIYLKVLTKVWLPLCPERYNYFTLFTADSVFHFVENVKPTQCYFRFKAINRTKKLTCETDEILITGMELFSYFTKKLV